MKLIETKTLTSTQSSIEFTGIPQNFTDLFILASLRGNTAQIYTLTELRFNGSSTGNSSRTLEGNGSTSSSQSLSTYIYPNAGNGANSTSNTFSNQSIYIPNYAGSINKSVTIDAVLENNATTAYSSTIAGLWSNTAAITSLAILTNDLFVAGSTISLYGIGGAGDGYAPKATGGSIEFVNGYWIHTFTASGTFTPTASIDCEYLVIAGGGGGGDDVGGGGGAGGYRTNVGGTLLSLATGSPITVTVGAGGSRGTNSTSTNGQNSSFSTITSAGGGRSVQYGSSGFAGGSGGGGGSGGLGGAGNTPSTTPSQGNNGANGQAINGPGGGGGGAGAAASGVTGGAGASSSITGTAVTRAGGGGAGGGVGCSGQGAGGAGGGGNGGSGTGTAGTANTGGGGGGGGCSGGQGGNGGSGIVIVRYAA